MSLKIHFLIKYIMSLLLQGVGVMNNIVPKQQNMILIYNSKETYMNNYALFQYLKEHNYTDKYIIVYAMQNVRHYIKETDRIILLDLNEKFSYIKVVWMFFKSRYVFYDNSNLRIKPGRKQIIINLWHGTPLKRIGFMSKASTVLTRNSLNCYNKILLSNEEQDEIFVQSFRLSKHQIYHLGYPRNDLLFSEEQNFCKIIGGFDKYTNHIMWMTTYRITHDGISHTKDKNWSQTGIPLLVNEAYLDEINEYLKELNTLLIIKMHTNTIQKYSNNNFSNIRYLQEDDYLSRGVQLYELLNETDALITDYSSIYFDYLLLNKPIGFVLEDLESYQEKNGLYYEDVKEYMPGEYIYDMEELKLFLSSLDLQRDKNEQNRKRVNQQFNKYDTRGKNTELLLKEFDITYKPGGK